MKAYTKAVRECRDRADAGCEAALRAAGGPLDGLLAATEGPTRRACSAESADTLTFSLGLDDLVFRTAQACEKWAEDFVAVAYADDLAALSPAARICQRRVAKQLGRLRDRIVVAYGRKCYVREFAGEACDRPRRDAVVAKALAAARARITKRCGGTFDDLGLATGATLDERAGALADIVVGRTRHLAQRLYPPLDLGPTEFFGPSPVGVRTLDLLDASRFNETGTGPRPVKVEIYYPSTAEAVAGVPRDVIQILGIDIATTPTYRDVARAPGVFPVVLYSASSGGPRVENQTLAVHLASHGFLVAAAEHHGNDLLDPSGDPDTTTNRPQDMRFLVDQLLGFNAMPGHVLEGAIDGSRIGATGHSYGGYTAMALATGPFHLGAFADPRVKAILPLDGSAQVFIPEFPSAFSTITVPTLLLGGTQSPFRSLGARAREGPMRTAPRGVG